MRKPAFCIGDQLHYKCAVYQHLYFQYIDSTIRLLPKSEISSLLQLSMILEHLVGSEEDRLSYHSAHTSYKHKSNQHTCSIRS